jgi:hypothetical protein
MHATTANGAPRNAPYQRQSDGNSASVSATNPAATAALIHHGLRSRIANSEFSAILHFIAVSLGVDGRRV